MTQRTQTLRAWLNRGYRCDVDKAHEKWGWSVREYQRTVMQLKLGGHMIDADLRYSERRGRWVASHQLIRRR